jgi:hypothetical protein
MESGGERKKRTTRNYSLGYGEVHRKRREEQELALERAVHAKPCLEFMRHVHHSANLQIISELSPNLGTPEHCRNSGNTIPPLSAYSEDEEKLWFEWRKVMKKCLVSQVKVMKEFGIVPYYSQICGFGLFTENSLEKFVFFGYSKISELSAVEDEAIAWGRCWMSPEGNLFWTFGVSGMLNHACSVHCSLDVKLEDDEDLLTISIRRKPNIPCGEVLTYVLSKMIVVLNRRRWNYNFQNKLNCMACDVLEARSLKEKAERAIKMLEPYCTVEDYGESAQTLMKYLPISLRRLIDSSHKFGSSKSLKDRRQYVEEVLNIPINSITKELCYEKLNSLDRDEMIKGILMYCVFKNVQ